MRRKSVVLALTSALFLSISLMVGATTNDKKIEVINHQHLEGEEIPQNEETSKLEVIDCECGGTFNGPVETAETRWYTEKYVQCNYNSSILDEVEYQAITKVYLCDKCDLAYSTTQEEYRDNCSNCNHL